MDDNRFDRLTRQVATLAPIDRKTALAMVGSSLAAIAMRPQSGAARKHRKHKHDACKKQVRRQCANQEDACRSFWDAECGNSQGCKDYYRGCCQYLGKCKGSQYFDCAFIP